MQELQLRVLVCITRVSRQILRRRNNIEIEPKSPNIDHRNNLPFDFMDVLEADNDPLVFPLVVGRGFLLELAASDDGRGAASFITIFAWISSSLVALTFLGQNSVTNLRGNSDTSHRTDCVHIRPKMPPPPFSVFSSSLFSLQHVFDSPANGGEGVLQDGNLVVSRHILSR